MKKIVQIKLKVLLDQLSARSTARENELLRRIESLEAELLTRSSIAPNLPQQNFFPRQVYDELKDAKQLLIDANQEVKNWKADALEWKENAKLLEAHRASRADQHYIGMRNF